MDMEIGMMPGSGRMAKFSERSNDLGRADFPQKIPAGSRRGGQSGFDLRPQVIGHAAAFRHILPRGDMPGAGPAERADTEEVADIVEQSRRI
jgi:hypothetical protein